MGDGIGDNRLKMLHLQRDTECLAYWAQVQRHMETPLYVCAVE